MRKILLGLIFAALASSAQAADNYAATPGTGLTFGAKDAAGVLYSRFIGCDNTTVSQCWAVDASGRLTVNINGTVTVTGAGGTFPATQSGTWTVQPGNTANSTAWLVTGTGGTFPIPANSSVNVAQINGVTPLMGQGATGTGSPRVTIANDNTIPTGWPTAANQTAAAAARGEGATGAAVPSGSVYMGMNVSGNLTGLTGTAGNLNINCQVGCSASTAITSWGGGTLGAMANYGTSPGAVLVPGVNAFVTNSNANGRAAASAASPVVPVAAASTAGAIVPNNTTAVVVKASAGTLFGVQVYGINAAPAYLKIYNATSATCGSGTPVKRLMIPAAATAANGAGSNVTFGPGLAMGTGITYCVTTGIADADTTAPTASNFLVNVDYE